jgi:RNA polymerase sigma-70 factor (sigma-E family)
VTGFAEFVESRRPALWRTAWALTGDSGRADDLVQTALMKVWPRWQTVAAGGDPEPYVRRVIYTTYVSWWHRRWRAEAPVAEVPEQAATSNDTSTAMLRHDLLVAMSGLSRGQRAALVCRYFDDLSEAQTAAVLGCSVGTVKSQTSRALAVLRTTFTEADRAAADLIEKETG